MKLKSFTRKFLTQTSKETSKFYDDLIEGNVKRFIVGADKRYKSDSPLQVRFLDCYFDEVVKEHIQDSDVVLDFGCGSGIFSRRLSPLCKKVVGVDISNGFIGVARENSSDYFNVEYYHLTSTDRFFDVKNEAFDVVVCVDVIHHLERPEVQILNPINSLKKGGKFLIYEPNLLNPILFLMHLFDKNERGLLRLGTIDRYQKLLNQFALQINHVSYNGIVIGPANLSTWWMSKILQSKYFSKLKWLSPKILIVCTKL